MIDERRPTGHLPRLPAEHYRGFAGVFWTHAIAGRETGWLADRFHAAFRENMLHAALRESLYCPSYTLMPDHIHVVWMGTAEESDQRTATRFLREQLAPQLMPHEWQRQPHDHVLRHRERSPNALAATCDYIAQNPVRAGLVAEAKDWPFTQCVIPGYPALSPFRDDFWEKFWLFYHAACDAGGIGKLKLSPKSSERRS